MFVHILSFFLYGTICFSRYIPPSLKENRNGAGQKKFIPQGGSLGNYTRGQEAVEYLAHVYYDVEYADMPVWPDISDTGNRSSVSDTDDSPPFSIITLTKWLFPFYGHLHKEVYIDPNGFLSMVPRHCDNQGYCGWSSDPNKGYKRYIAPLMSDFDPRSHKFSNVYSSHTTDSLVIQWNDVLLYKYHPERFNKEEHAFTFQAVLKENGDIIFNYKKLPYYPANQTVDSTNTQFYPTKMGVEDAAIIDLRLPFDPKVYPVALEYAPLHLDWRKIFHMFKKSGGNGVSVRLIARPTCVSFDSCATCSEHHDLADKDYIAGKLQCGWCAESKVCIDRFGRDAGDLQTNVCSGSKSGSMKPVFTHRSQCLGSKGQAQQLSPIATILIVLLVTVGLTILGFIVVHLVLKVTENKSAKYSQNVPDEPHGDSTKSPGIQQVDNNQRDQHPELSA